MNRLPVFILMTCCWLGRVGGLVGTVVLMACSQEMESQPSFSYQEAPRRQSPPDSIARSSATSGAQLQPPQDEQGSRLFAVNCRHCHGSHGDGDGPVAGYLQQLPVNLHAPSVQSKSPEELFLVITQGLDVMPAFKPYLSSQERWALVNFVHSLNHQPTGKPTP